jgi:hypothetical protein
MAESRVINTDLTRPFDDFISEIKAIQRLYYTTGAALGVLATLPKEKFIVQSGPYSMVDIACTESTLDSPLLNRVFVVFLWSALEVLIEDFLAVWIFRNPSLLESEELKDVKLAVREMLLLDHDGRARYLIQEVGRRVRSPLKSGIDRFESLLSAFGLPKEVAPDLRRNLYELSHVRNVLLHKNAKSDRKFVAACPWLGYQVGDSVRISSEHFDRYYNAILDYSGDLLDRITRVAANNKTCGTSPADGN